MEPTLPANHASINLTTVSPARHKRSACNASPTTSFPLMAHPAPAATPLSPTASPAMTTSPAHNVSAASISPPKAFVFHVTISQLAASIVKMLIHAWSARPEDICLHLITLLLQSRIAAKSVTYPSSTASNAKNPPPALSVNPIISH